MKKRLGVILCCSRRGVLSVWLIRWEVVSEIEAEKVEGRMVPFIQRFLAKYRVRLSGEILSDCRSLVGVEEFLVALGYQGLVLASRTTY